MKYGRVDFMTSENSRLKHKEKKKLNFQNDSANTAESSPHPKSLLPNLMVNVLSHSFVSHSLPPRGL